MLTGVIKDKIKWTGKVTMIKKIGNKIVKKRVFCNIITNLALNEIIKSLYGESSMNLKYLAIGDDDTAAQASDTQLGNEFFRAPIITQTVSGTGELTSRSIMLDSEPFDAVGPAPGFQCTIKEIGFFGGFDAISTQDSGTLIARLVLATPEDKYDNEQIAFTRVDSIERG